MFEFFRKWFGTEPEKPSSIISPDSAGMSSVADEEGHNETPQGGAADTEGMLCPVCGQYSFREPHDICPVCGWEQDGVQQRDPDFEGGANSMSLNQAKAAYKAGEGVR